jgi:large subunit ribosomal protein L21
MEYAVFIWGGQQFIARAGETIEGEKLEGKEGDKVLFDQVLLYRTAQKMLIGDPYLPQIKVEAKIVKQGKAQKIRVAKYKAKTHYRRVRGHRQLKTQVKIEKILVKSEKSIPHYLLLTTNY